MNTMFYYSRLIDNLTDNGSAKKSGTFGGWQEKAIKARAALKKVRDDYNADLKEILETYSPNVAAQKKAALDERFDSVVKSAADKLEQELDEVIESKRRQFDKCSGAPSAEDLRLLQALSMRSNLTIAEVAAVASKLNGNTQSLAVLRDIADKFNIKFPIGAASPEEFDIQIKRAREFSLDRLRDLATPDEEMGYKGKLFYEHPGTGEAAYFFNPLDNNILTTEQISAATMKAREAAAEKTTSATEPVQTATDPDSMWAEVTCTGQMHLATIAQQFHVSTQQIREANPGKDLDRIYSGDKILVPSVRFSFQPDPTGSHVQPDMVKAVPAPMTEYQTGPNGEEIGADISVT